MVNIEIIGHGMQVTEALKMHAEKKLQKLEKYANAITHIKLILEVEKSHSNAKLTLHMHGNEMFAHSKTQDMYNSIDDVAHKMQTQINKMHEKLSEHTNGGE